MCKKRSSYKAFNCRRYATSSSLNRDWNDGAPQWCRKMQRDHANDNRARKSTSATIVTHNKVAASRRRSKPSFNHHGLAPKELKLVESQKPRGTHGCTWSRQHSKVPIWLNFVEKRRMADLDIVDRGAAVVECGRNGCKSMVRETLACSAKSLKLVESQTKLHSWLNLSRQYRTAPIGCTWEPLWRQKNGSL